MERQHQTQPPTRPRPPGVASGPNSVSGVSPVFDRRQSLLRTQPPPTTEERLLRAHPSGLKVLFVVLLRKEVIQPHLPVRLPCYDFVPIADPTFDSSLPQGVRPPASGVANFRDVTGGVYK